MGLVFDLLLRLLYFELDFVGLMWYYGCLAVWRFD